MHLALFLSFSGSHLAGWRHPLAGQGDPFDIARYQRIAAQAEAAKLDMLFVADKLSIDDIYGGTFEAAVRLRPAIHVEPLTLLSALAVSTSRIGLGATISTSYSEPYHAARMFASIDHFSGGRAAWNAVTSVNDGEARNFSREEHLGHAERYERAAEFIDVVRLLWDTWEEDAIAPDKAAARYSDPARIHYADHRGKWFQVKGPLGAVRPPQGHPVLIQAGVSGAFQQLAAQGAEVIFPVQSTLEKARAFYADFKAQVVAAGRAPDSVKVLPGIVPIIADTDEEALQLEAELDALIDPEAGLSFMSGSMNYDLSVHPIDGPVPDIRDRIRGSKGRFDVVLKDAMDRGLTLGELGRSYAKGLAFAKFVGSPRTVADQMERWVAERGADGFVVMPPYMPGGAERFLEGVVPELQRRGLFRTEYEGTTLREHLGLERPGNRFDADFLAAAAE
ncbi:LLM class flavin-dependent oxidoreductase [Novosphingobium resinovorum]|uniref:LLM class flavin-dependent oxidoreductase n=1 Tax=Novosphingobium resinovorum TaxID=158500 RepID=UPI002ED16BFC|nr:LLM class flavin-dependent oxidoreductase [Novosphingobium resinovorum]